MNTEIDYLKMALSFGIFILIVCFGALPEIAQYELATSIVFVFSAFALACVPLFVLSILKLFRIMYIIVAACTLLLFGHIYITSLGILFDLENGNTSVNWGNLTDSDSMKMLVLIILLTGVSFYLFYKIGVKKIKERSDQMEELE